jgi:DNA (cytosine-5)-methyltransferase 1
MKVLDLFSGIGGFSLGLERAGFETAAFCEIEPFCQKVLKKHWPEVPIYNDITKLTKEVLENDGIGTIDLICGGYPCQPFSTAGKRGGAEDERHLWPEMLRLIRTIGPRWVIAENVEGHIKLGLDTVLNDLETEDYTVWPFIIAACAVGAPHQRNRLWIIAHSNNSRDRTSQSKFDKKRSSFKQKFKDIPFFEFGRYSEDVANTASKRQSGQGKFKQRLCKAQNSERQTNIAESISFGGFWSIEPAVGRVANGIPSRVDRLKALGNAVVPQIPELIGKAIIEYENNNRRPPL